MFDRLISYFARLMPHSLAVSTLGGQATYAEFDAQINQMAAALAEHDLPRPGVTGVCVAEPYVHWVVLLALARLRVTSTSYLAGQRCEMEAITKPDFIIIDAGSMPEGETRPSILRLTPEWLAATSLRSDAPPPSPSVDADSAARITTSSGTTGRPKAFAASWRGVELRIVHESTIESATTINQRLISLIGPEHFPFPGLLTTWGAGGTVLFGPSDPVQLAHALAKLRPTAIRLAPIQLKVLLDALPAGFMTMNDTWVSVFGSHTPKALREAARMRLAANLINVYATSETWSIALRTDTVGGDDDDVGFVYPWTELEIVDDAGTSLPAGELGQIRVRQEAGPTGYIGDAEATERAFRDGWFYPGDVGSLSTEGRLRIAGRIDEVMNFGGPKFMPYMIETAALACPGVQDAGAFVMTDAAGLATPWIAIVRDATLKEADLVQALCLPGLPQSQVVWIDAVPRNVTGKIDRQCLQMLTADMRRPT